MVEITTIFKGLSISMFQIAQAPVIQEPIPRTAPPEAASILISGPQFFIALLSGLLLAFAFQLVFTNLSVAAGISILGRSSNSSSQDNDGGGISVRKISFAVGIWTLITVTLALFAACFLAVQLSLVTSGNLGAIIGLVIWAAYFSLLVWFSSTTVSSLIGSVVNAATSGFQSILGTATAVIGSQAAKRQAVSTAEAVASAVRNELGAGIDPASIRRSIEDYFQRLQLPGFDFHRIRQDLVDLLNDPDIQTLAEDDRLRHIDRQTFLDLISKRTDFSREEVNRLADLLEGAWRQALGQRRRPDSTAELVDYLRSTQSGQLKVEELNAKIDRLLAEREQGRATQTDTGRGMAALPSSGQGIMQQTLQFGMNTLIGLLVGRTDLSDLDLQKILNRLQAAPERLSEQRDKLLDQVQGATESQYSPIRTDVEHYLMNAYSWQMTPERVAKEFRDVLYDPDADPAAVADQLSQLDRNYFVERLSSRGVFTQDKIQQLADTLNAVRLEVIAAARLAKEREIALDLRQRVGTYLTLTPRDQLHGDEDGILPAFKALLQDEEAEYETLRLRLSSYDRDTLRQILWQRADLTPEETETILNYLEATRDRVLWESQSFDEQAKQQLSLAQQKLEDYLRNTGKAELNPEGIKRDLQLLISDPQLGLSSLRNRAAHVDRDTLVQLLRQREDISEAEAYQIVDQIETNWRSLLSSPRVLTEQVKAQYDQTLNSIADYLRRTNLEELNPEGIQRDLTTLLEDPKEGTLALRRRLSQIDRQTLVRLLGQREGMSEAQVNHTIDQLQEGINRIIKSPRRLALRAQQQVMDFEASIEDYLRNTDKEELNPEGIKRDFSLLLQSPQLGLQSLSDRLSRFDRSTLVALLAQRPDMTPEEANRVVMQIESVRDQVLDQMRQIQYRIQSVIDRIFARIRDYLNSLNRPELNYEGIRQDIRTLFDDPQAGFEALRQRLSEFDRGTLVALLSSRKDISEADANRLIDQVESARNSVLQRAERIQTEAQQRLEEVKYQAQRQVEETRKAAATAAWWLFLTALVSAAAAAGAGALAAI
ncbi:MFS transporter [Thermocoleostomius sinensis]|uniref:MFS transporter n=1 Tax=Thermocoleostomius sinensis A174 TaxID=2016057 RepID=A0A9E9C5G7_9CYAN|nr:MFS transporter [Thermocoleostomius sinensis]WAL58159.1 MFS transporter [Thermocoleostomius sinensis A174]